MAFEHEKRLAARLLEVVEDGTLSVIDIRALYDEADPALVYLIFAWLRVRYPASHSAADGVLGRIVGACGSSRVARKVKEGEKDGIVTWFEETYEYRELARDEFIGVVVEKLES
jgi:hypothetical protein